MFTFVFKGCERQKVAQIEETFMRCSSPNRTSREQMGKLRQKAVPETHPAEYFPTALEIYWDNFHALLHLIFQHSHSRHHGEGRVVI